MEFTISRPKKFALFWLIFSLCKFDLIALCGLFRRFWSKQLNFERRRRRRPRWASKVKFWMATRTQLNLTCHFNDDLEAENYLWLFAETCTRKISHFSARCHVSRCSCARLSEIRCLEIEMFSHLTQHSRLVWMLSWSRLSSWSHWIFWIFHTLLREWAFTIQQSKSINTLPLSSH